MKKKFLNGPDFFRLINYFVFEYVIILAFSTIIGGVLGYYIGKNKSFEQPKWGKWLEEHVG